MKKITLAVCILGASTLFASFTVDKSETKWS